MQILSAVQSSCVGVIISLLELLAAHVLLVGRGHEVIGSTALVLLSSVEMIGFRLQNGLFPLVANSSLVISLDFSLVAFLSEVSIFVLRLFELLGTGPLVSHCEVLVKSVGL